MWPVPRQTCVLAVLDRQTTVCAVSKQRIELIICCDHRLNDDVNWCNCVTISSEIHFASKGMLNAWLKNVHHTLLTRVACFSQDSDRSHPCFLFCCNVRPCCVSSSWWTVPAPLTHFLITFYSSSDVVIKRLWSPHVTSVFSQSCWHLFWKEKQHRIYIIPFRLV